MGARVRFHEGYYGSFFEHFNMRFGPTETVQDPIWRSGGIAEIAELQRQFQIFRHDRPFVASAALLGLGGLISGPAKDLWIDYLHRLPTFKSNEPPQNGDELIVGALIKNFEKDDPLPCFMQAHDGRLIEPGLVMIEYGPPTFFLEPHRFLTIRLPFRPAG